MSTAPDFATTGGKVGEPGTIGVMFVLAFNDIAARSRFGVLGCVQCIYRRPDE